MRSTIAGILGVLALGGALSSSACASDASEAVGEEPEPSSSDGSSSSTTDDEEPAERPTFDASFPDEEEDANVDPTPPNGDTCVDNDDPGGSENTANKLPATDDCDDKFKSVKGVLNGAVDVDFYKVSGADKAGCKLETQFGSSTSGVELCVYARCKNATKNAVTGCAQGVEDTSLIGMKGCCAAAPAKATPEWDCDGFTDNDSADFTIRVRQAKGGDTCLPYNFTYRY